LPSFEEPRTKVVYRGQAIRADLQVDRVDEVLHDTKPAGRGRAPLVPARLLQPR
jgi:hypothetical protein